MAWEWGRDAARRVESHSWKGPSVVLRQGRVRDRPKVLIGDCEEGSDWLLPRYILTNKEELKESGKEPPCSTDKVKVEGRYLFQWLNGCLEEMTEN